MKSSINLLAPEFKPRFEWVCASHLTFLVVFTLIFTSITYAGSYYLYDLKLNEVDAIEARINTEQNTINELTTALTSRTTDPLLESKLANFIALTQSRSVLLKQIKGLSSLKQRSFSVLFDSFAQAHSPELWLTEFEVSPSDMNISGQISRPKALPIWISQLSETDYFKGQQFDDASVEREQNMLVFKLNSSVNPSLSPTVTNTISANRLGVNQQSADQLGATNARD